MIIGGGHTIYLTEPSTNSNEHIESPIEGQILVFVGVPSIITAVEPEQRVSVSIVPEPLMGGRIVG